MKTCMAKLVTCSILLTVVSSDSKVQNGDENQESNSIKGLSGPELVSKITVDTRVVRGKDWTWGNQDGGPGGVGTVTHEIKDGWVQVEWDSGVKNSYRMGNDNKYELDLADSSSVIVSTTPTSEPTSDRGPALIISEPQTGEIFKVGSRVVRGRDWSWDDQDGGEGNVGEIVAINNYDKWVTVKWDLLGEHQYRMGNRGKYDLKLAPEDISTMTTPNGKPYSDTETIDFSEPEFEDIFKVGSRVVRGKDWRWDNQDGGEGNVGEIVDIDSNKKLVTIKWDSLGTHEYPMGNKGMYYIMLAPENIKTPTALKKEPSQFTETAKISGPELVALIEVGTRVVRGRDWDWGDQDGGEGYEGEVIAIDSSRKTMTVEWDLGGINQYRMGYKGKYDLMLALDTTKITTTPTIYMPKIKLSKVAHTAVISDPESGDIFKVGSRVVRGRDWDWDDQDGGEGNEGEIIAIDGKDQMVRVEWDLEGQNLYRMGHKGKYDLTLAPETNKRFTTISRITSTTSPKTQIPTSPTTQIPISATTQIPTSPITQIPTSTTKAKVILLKSIEPATHESTSMSTSDNVQESNKIFGLLVAKEIARVPLNYRLQIFQEILEVFKKFYT